MQNKIDAISLEHFTFIRKAHTGANSRFMLAQPATKDLLVAEASDLKGQPWLPVRLFDDACDEGIAIRSHHTGRVRLFALDQVERDREGDLVAFHFSSVDGEPMGVTIFND